MISDVEGRASGRRMGLRNLFRINLGDLMLWVALLGGCLALARQSWTLGLAAFGLFAPALARTISQANRRRSQGTPPGIGLFLVELGRSFCLVVLAYGWTLLVYLASTIVFAWLLNVVILAIVCVGSIGNGDAPDFFETADALQFGAKASVPVALFAFVREFRRLWRSAADRPTSP
jgi:hypothetical protein